MKSLRHFLLSGAVCGGLAFAGFSSGIAAAAENAPSVLKPDSGWAVSKIAAKAMGGEAYCAVAIMSF
jgi:hypothetical protein